MNYRGFLLVALFALAACGSPGGKSSGAILPNAVGVRSASGSPGFAGTRVYFEHSLVCDNGVLIANYVKTYGIKRIFVPVTGDDIISLLANNPNTVKNLNAMSAVATVYMVSGDVSWLSSPTTLPAGVPNLIKIASMYPQFTGILYAVDPETSTSWNSQRQSVLQSYFTLQQTLLAAPGASSFGHTLFLAHADFATIKYGTSPSSPTVLTQLQTPAAVTGTVVMVPGGSASVQLTNVNPALPLLTKPFWLEASTTKYGGNSYYGVTASYLQSNLTQVQQTVAAANKQFIGIDVNGWNDLYNSLDSVLPQPPVYNGILPTGPLVPPAGTNYIGAFVKPGNGKPSAQLTATFEKQIGRTLGYNMHFYGFRQPFPTALETDDVAHGRIPLIAWNCGNSDAAVVGGYEDSTIRARALSLKAFGKPVILRWFWEMNLDDTNNAPRWECWDSKTDLPNGYFSPTEYIAAWKHIRSIFASEGVTNVVWEWCVANAHGGPGQYYPGDDQVDWVAMDDYDTNDVSMGDTFDILSDELSQFQEKPFMITETGAHSAIQPSFLTGAAAELKSQFPWVRAVGYLDAQGSNQNWVLTTTGITDFATFAKDPYMSAMGASAPIQ